MIKLYNENCLNVLKNIEDNTIDLIVTDPPYKVTQRGNKGTMGGMIVKEVNAKYNQISRYIKIGVRENAAKSI